MRVLQTIGHQQGRPTAFYYVRNKNGVTIVQIRGEAVDQETVISNSIWQAILETIGAGNKTFAVTNKNDNADAPSRNLYEELRDILKNNHVRNVGDSLVAYVSAILLHEGTLELYHGVMGDREARVFLRCPS